MKRAKLKRRPPVVNLIPMIDVLMTILIFFVILTMVMGNQKKIDVALPQDLSESASPAPSVDPSQLPPDPLVIVVNPEGQLTIRDQVIADDAAYEAAKAQLAKHPQAVVILTGDKEAPYSKILNTMQQLQLFDDKRITLALEKAPKELPATQPTE